MSKRKRVTDYENLRTSHLVAGIASFQAACFCARYALVMAPTNEEAAIARACADELDRRLRAKGEVER